MNKTRRHFSSPERVAILKRHLVEKTRVSDLCDELGIGPSQFDHWQKEFFENGHAAFENNRKLKKSLGNPDRILDPPRDT